MAEKELGTVASRNSKYHVKWNDSNQQVYVKKITGLWASWDRCDAKAKTAGDAMDVASAYVRYKD
jgi:hypothetical protein